jgi:hypothetical protein
MCKFLNVKELIIFIWLICLTVYVVAMVKSHHEGQDNVSNYDEHILADIVLPANSYGIVGREWNLYYQNITSYMNDDRVDVRVEIDPAIDTTQKLEGCLRIIPEKEDLGTHVVTFRFIDKATDKLIDFKKLNLTIYNDSDYDNTNVIFIGDSLIDAGVIPGEIQYELSGNKIISLGTQETKYSTHNGDYDVLHEGRSGWSVINYVEMIEYKEIKNPFYHEDMFDFEYYVTSNLGGYNLT